MYYTSDDYPFLDRKHGGRFLTFAAPSDHGNAIAVRVGQMVGENSACLLAQPRSDEAVRQRRRIDRQLKLFEGFPKGMRLRPGRRYQQAASDGP